MGVSGWAPTASRIGAGGVWVIAAWWAGDLALAGRTADLLDVLPWLLLVCVVVWAVFWRPAVLVDDDAVTLRNPLRETRVPWSALEGVETRFALTLLTERGRHQSWAAAAPGRPGVLRLGSGGLGGRSRPGAEAGRHDMPRPAWNPDATTGRSSSELTSDSGAAAFLVESSWRAWRDRQGRQPGGDRPEPVGVRWNAAAVAAAAALVVLGVLTAVL